MNFRDWYTDTVDIWRVSEVKDGALTRHERKQIAAGIPCRVYQMGDGRIQMEPTAARVEQGHWLQCDNLVDIEAGDELLIHRGAGLGKEVKRIRAFASEPNHYFEPFGAVLPGLAHQEIRLLQEERVRA